MGEYMNFDNIDSLSVKNIVEYHLLSKLSS